jgi:copper chaperone
MKYVFKTNIDCSGCLRAVTPFINEVEGIQSWTVDTEHPEKLLTVETSASEEAIMEKVEEAGFDIAPWSAPA